MSENKAKKSRFALGFVLGMLATAVTGFCMFLGWYFAFKDASQGYTISERTAYKVDYIEELIDAYYLNDVDKTSVENGIYEGMLAGLEDPYSEYYTPEEYQALIEDTSGTYYGIGALVSQNIETYVITVLNPFKGAPAAKAGMLKGDIIYKIDGEDVTSQNVETVVKKLKGEKGTQVVVTVYRETDNKYIDLTITRDEVNVPTVEYKMIDKKNKIGYIKITQFEQVTTEQFREAVTALQAKGMKAVIFDVRDNPGGLYSVVCDILDDILGEGTLVYTKDKYDNEDKVTSDARCLDIPMVVLQNGNSASASEIFAGAINDFQAGTIIGEQSYGKGVVQTILPLRDGSAVKLTIQKYYTPKGINIHGTGITPDMVVEDNVETKKDEQLNAAIEVLKK